jgi:hypothetical protein
MEKARQKNSLVSTENPNSVLQIRALLRRETTGYSTKLKRFSTNFSYQVACLHQEEKGFITEAKKKHGKLATIPTGMRLFSLLSYTF